jgi:hypothetical protein
MDSKPDDKTTKEKAAIPNTLPAAHAGHEEFFQFFMKVPLIAFFSQQVVLCKRTLRVVALWSIWLVKA